MAKKEQNTFSKFRVFFPATETLLEEIVEAVYPEFLVGDMKASKNLTGGGGGVCV